MENSNIVFNYEMSQDCEPPFLCCNKKKHNFNSRYGPFCISISEKILRIRFALKRIQGNQSESYMKMKIISLLEKDITQLPKRPNEKISYSNKTYIKWVHALLPTLLIINDQIRWFEVNINQKCL